MSCKQEFANVIQARIAAHMSSILLEFKFTDGSYSEFVLTRCQKSTDSSLNSLLRSRRGAKDTTITSPTTAKNAATTQSATTPKSATTTQSSTLAKNTATTQNATTPKSATTTQSSTLAKNAATTQSATTKQSATAPSTTAKGNAAQGKQLYVP
ncbi:unnamed protein product [Rotaria sordida]|uniref:Uncharacterized protein n=1 Tax=Rotaria sordida TaxID=392033 RepID=A0A819WB98_9BILA|nr:unnamed protein product [Rotaria sordida]